MLDHLTFYLVVVVLITFLIMLADKIKVAYPILLVLAGLGISFIPGIPMIHIEPELIFLIFLPPLLYEAAWTTSWKELWRWRRIVLSFAFIVVLLTAIAVALVSNYFIPGISLALGFLLGGIVSPPDAVSAGAILKYMKIPKRYQSILAGESLLNDASSLIIFRFALVAVATGQFIWSEAAASFLWMCLGGVLIGVLVGLVFYKVHRFFPTSANIDIILTFVAPFVMYITAEELHASGVLSVVAGGLFLSYRAHQFLSSSSRLRAVTVWESIVFILNGIVFMLIGLDLPEIVQGLEDTSVWTAFKYGVLITAMLILVRILATYSAIVVSLVMRNFITIADPDMPANLKTPMIFGWSGMRGVVSLAAALSIPLTLSDGSPFPQRNLILFITFVVILLTLVVQGMTLPWLISKIKLEDRDFIKPEKQIDNEIRHELAKIAIAKVRKDYQNQLEQFPALAEQLQIWENRVNSSEIIFNYDEYRDINTAILEEQRKWLIAKNRSELLLDEEIIRRHLRLLDLQEEKLNLGS
ncbi:Na+/H+ antiporter [Chryseobacterium sp. R2A-55]|uniref:Na+/H+ antiporter n=1 Tax=Chryseobacterium sp. R2A-55 TaxID=2744445 RepID=UPI001F31E2FC|nr:Na+/H+ antiporter [Chryseobacterium sp. R2A-55]